MSISKLIWALLAVLAKNGHFLIEFDHFWVEIPHSIFIAEFFVSRYPILVIFIKMTFFIKNYKISSDYEHFNVNFGHFLAFSAVFAQKSTIFEFLSTFQPFNISELIST